MASVFLPSSASCEVVCAFNLSIFISRRRVDMANSAPPDLGERQVAAVAANVLDRTFAAPAPNRKWIADFTYVWTVEGWLYVAVVIDLFSRRVVGWSMSARSE